jgi:hypothetical protein
VEYEQFSNLSDLDPGAGNEEGRRAFISGLIAVAADDVRNLLLTATVAVGIVVFLIKDSVTSIRALGAPYPLLAVLATAVLLSSAGLLFWYAAHVNRRRMSLARCLATNNAGKARDLWAGPEHGVRAEHGRLLKAAMASMGLGLVLSAAVVAALLLG